MTCSRDCGYAFRRRVVGRHLLKKIAIPGDYGWELPSPLTVKTGRLYVRMTRRWSCSISIQERSSGKSGRKRCPWHRGGPGTGARLYQCDRPRFGDHLCMKTLARDRQSAGRRRPERDFYDGNTKRVFTIDRGCKRVSAIDPKSGKVVGTVEGLGGRTEHAVSDEGGHIFLNMQYRNRLLKLDAAGTYGLETWPLAPCGQPSSMDMHPSTSIYRMQERCHDGGRWNLGPDCHDSADRRGSRCDRIRPRERVDLLPRAEMARCRSSTRTRPTTTRWSKT